MGPSRRREEVSLRNPRAEVDPSLGQRLFYALRRIAQGIEVESRRLAKMHGVTGPQLVCLRAVVAYGPTTATDVSDRVYLSPSTVVGIFDRLAAKGLMERRRDREDRRVVFVTATEAGRAAVAQAPHPLHEAIGSLLTGRTKAEQKALTEAIDELAQLIAEPTESE